MADTNKDKITQDNRLLKLETPLGKDVLLIDKISVEEGISKLFDMHIDVRHENDPSKRGPFVINPKDILGQTIAVLVIEDDANKTSRTFNGIVTEFYQGEHDDDFTHYKMRARPAVWMLTQIHQSRIFQQKSVPQILEEVIGSLPFEKSGLNATYEPREYCVQYRESDFDFISRLMEEEGIFYYFEHTEDTHKMILGDNAQAHKLCPSKNEVPFHLDYKTDDSFSPVITAWETQYSYQTGSVLFWDSNFQRPGSTLEAACPSQNKIASNDAMLFYEYPGGYGRKYDGIDAGGGDQAGKLNKITDDGDRTARNMMERFDCRYQISTGESSCCSFTAGHKFKLINHPTKEANKSYVVTSITHTATQNPDYRSFAKSEERGYSNRFKCIGLGEGTVTFRPERVTPKPVIWGGQTAFVEGPDNEEIFTDKYGRIKVQFHWNRDSKKDGSDSCWLRVVQAWAGSNWGSMFIPRIGMEVLVHFLDGDPDKPIVTGCVYNPKSMPPYTLPDEKTKSTLKSNSTKDGSGFNEFRFEDLKGSEQIFKHAEKDLDIRVKNDERHIVKADHHLIIKGVNREKVEGNEHRTVDSDHMTLIKGDQNLKVNGEEAVQVDGNLSLKVGGNVAENFGANHSEQASGSIYLKAGSTLVLEAGAGITLSVGGSFVTVNSAGVQISGPTVLINSGGAALPGTPGSLKAPTAPEDPDEADDGKPGTKAALEKRSVERKQVAFKPLPVEAKKEDSDKKTPTHWIEISLVDEVGKPVPSEAYKIKMPDGTYKTGTTNQKGKAKIQGIKDAGNCEISFPNLDKEAIEEA